MSTLWRALTSTVITKGTSVCPTEQGVYILGLDLRYYTLSEWVSGTDAWGVVVVQDADYREGILKQDLSGTTYWMGKGVTETNTYLTDESGWVGYQGTQYLVETYGWDRPAAIRCWNTTDPFGDHCYLPSYRQYEIIKNLSMGTLINTAMDNISGGVPMYETTSGYLRYTCTQYNSNEVWGFTFGSSRARMYKNYNPCLARPFFNIPNGK